MDAFEKIIMTVALVIGIFILPTMNITLSVDDTSQKVIDNAVQEFVDNCRSSGKITVFEYENMIQTINNAQSLSNVHITYGKESFVPDDTGEGVYRYHNHFGEAYILDVLYPDIGENQDFYMAKGDYLHVTVENTEPTLGANIYSLFVQEAQKTPSIFTSYGGYVENNGWKG